MRRDVDYSGRCACATPVAASDQVARSSCGGARSTHCARNCARGMSLLVSHGPAAGPRCRARKAKAAAAVAAAAAAGAVAPSPLPSQPPAQLRSRLHPVCCSQEPADAPPAPQRGPASTGSPLKRWHDERLAPLAPSARLPASVTSWRGQRSRCQRLQRPLWGHIGGAFCASSAPRFSRFLERGGTPWAPFSARSLPGSYRAPLDQPKHARARPQSLRPVGSYPPRPRLTQQEQRVSQGYSATPWCA